MARINLLKQLFIIVITLALNACGTHDVISLESLLEEMTDRDRVTLYPDHDYRLKQFSSYDRLSVAPGEEGWYANSDYSRFIRVDSSAGRREFVLFDHEGPGAVVRWWMTFAGEGSYDGTLRIYIDNSPEPVIEDKVLKVISGNLLAGEPLSSSVSELTPYHQRGHNLYLPIPYSKSCRISYECDALKEKDGRVTPSIYYNINYREYTGNPQIVSFSMAELEKNSELINSVNEDLVASASPPGESVSREGIIEAGDTLELGGSNRSGGALRALALGINSQAPGQSLRSLVLRISFDGKETVWVPAGDFFGTGHAPLATETWYTKTSDNIMLESFWIMPFKRDFKVELINFGEDTVECSLNIRSSAYKWRPGSMYFASTWHEYNRIKAGGNRYVGGDDKHIDINYADISGKGVYMGDGVTVFNTVDAWWGEGDEKIFVDGESFPSSIGTGTEDYYGYAWCRPEVFTHPFIAQPDGSGNFHPGMTVNSRYRNLDAIPFRQSISSNIELWHWAPAIVNYALTTYFYALPGYSHNIVPDPELVKLKVPTGRADLVPPVIGDNGIMEGENLQIESVSGGIAETQYIASWNWSGSAQLWYRDGSAGDILETSFISQDEGIFDVIASLSMARDYGIIRISINNGSPFIFNAYTDGEKLVKKNIGKVHLNRGSNSLTITVAGRDPSASEGNMAGIDYLQFIPVK